MKKDVIYIDIEDDITSIIEKVKDAKSSIVALVPPKRVGMLQSIVNLKLLNKAAKNAGKRVVLITNDTALTGLAAGVSIPVAKNLQSKPEIPEVAALNLDDEDVIEGENLPVGDVPDTSPMPSTNTRNYVEGPDDVVAPISEDGTPVALGAAALAPRRTTKIPNFDNARKKIFLISGLAVLLISFFVWALFFAPQASIAITAKTNIANIDKSLQLIKDGTVDTAQNILPPVVKQVKKTASVDFTPTGKKDVGEKSISKVKIKTTAETILLTGLTVPAGSIVTSSSGKTYTTDAAATFPKGDGTTLSGITVGVTASASGSSFNGAAGAATMTTAGVSSVAFTDATTGGTDKTITVVTADDIAKATDQLKAQDSNEVKTELQKQFSATDIVISDSFRVDPGTPTSAPAVDQEAGATAKLTSETTYTIVGIASGDLKKVHEDYLKTQLKSDGSQKIYDTGEKTTQFSQFEETDKGYTVKATAAGQIGPNINEATIAEQAKGKRSGEIQQSITMIQGVESVDVKLSPFWVMNAPGDAKKITVKFVLNKQ